MDYEICAVEENEYGIISVRLERPENE